MSDLVADVLFIEDIANSLRCSPSTIRRRVRAGLFPVPPLPAIDNRRRWSRYAFERWLRQGGGRR